MHATARDRATANGGRQPRRRRPPAAPTLPAALRAHSAVHAELLSRGARRLGAPIEEFVGFQLDVPNPPWMSMVAMGFDC